MKIFFKTLCLIFLVTAYAAPAQTIQMEFPAFAGKTYDFIIFQGDKQVKAQQDTIPKNGKFELKIPKEYAPYTGMCRWLITNTAEGGGIDMAIPGSGYKVSCLSAQPNNENILYEGYDAVNELNHLNQQQQIIIEKFEAMSRAAKLYGEKNPLYKTFEKEKQIQAQAYNLFIQKLKSNPNYNARFLPIVNLVNGIPPKLTDDYQERARLINDYITHELDYNALYTSGHWTGIIESWVQIQINIVNNKKVFAESFSKIGSRIPNPQLYTDFVGKVTYFLTKYGKDDYTESIAQSVLSSGKIMEYIGVLSVYQKAMIGMQAPDLAITEHIGKTEEHNHSFTIIKSKEFAIGNMQKTLLIFYESGCGPCEELLQQLPGKYEQLKAKGIDIIAIAADTGETLFKNTSRDFPWKRTYCDYEGKQGVNFKNYAVLGTPTLFLIDKTGNIEAKINTIDELLNETK